MEMKYQGSCDVMSCFTQGLDGLPGDKGDDGDAGQPVSDGRLSLKIKCYVQI